MILTKNNFKKMRAFVPLFLSLVMVFTACKKDDNDPLGTNSDAYENNNTRNDATVLTMGKQIDAYVDEKDVDWFQFTPSNVDKYDVTLIEATNPTEELRIALDIYDDQGNSLGGSSGDWGANVTINFSNNGGTYYVKITSLYGNSKGKYSLKISDTNSNDAYEPNETRASAYDLGTLPQTNINGNIVAPTEQDWYKFTTENSGIWDVVELKVDNSNSDFRVDLEIYDEQGNSLGGSSGDWGSDVLVNLFTKGGIYYVKISSLYEQKTSSYVLSIKNKNLNDSNESDDDFAHAQSIENFPSSKQGVIVSSGTDNYDYDFFKVKLPFGKKISWSIDPTADNTKLHFDVYDQNESSLGNQNGNEGQTISGNVNNTGSGDTYFYIKLGGFTGDNGNYSISFEESPADS